MQQNTNQFNFNKLAFICRSSPYLLAIRLLLLLLQANNGNKSLLFGIVSLNILYKFIINMKSLKLALATQNKDSQNGSQASSNKKSLLQGVNKSKSNVNWMIDIDNNQKISIQSLNDDELMRLIYDKLQEAFNIDSNNLSETLFQRILAECQQQTKQTKAELAFLELIHEKVLHLQELANSQFKKYLAKFMGRIQQKLTTLKAKEKKSQINTFDDILKGKFQKKRYHNPYLNIQQEPLPQKTNQPKSFSKSPNRDKTNSVDKFKGLLASEKMKDTLTLKKHQQDHDTTTRLQAEKNVSFSSVLSTTMAVKTRRRKASKEYKGQILKKTESKAQKEKQQEGDEAFIFFRPKKNKK